MITHKTILVVDDEPDLRDLLMEEFKNLGANVVGAANGQEAIEIIESQSVDVVISDVRMPGGDGASLLEKIRKIDPKKPHVFFLTGFADMDSSEAVRMGAKGLFHKPIDWAVLIETIEACLKEK